MRLLVISYAHSDKNSVGSLRSNTIERLLPSHGIEVFVLTSGKHDEEIRTEQNLVSIRSNEYSKAKKFRKIFQKAAKKFLRTARYGSAATQWERLAEKYYAGILNKTNPDVIFCTYPPVTALRLGMKYSRMSGLPLVTDFRDSFLVNPIEPGLKHSWAYKHRYYKSIKNNVLSSSTLITAASAAISQEFRSENSHSKVVTIYNGFEEREARAKKKYFDRGLINIIHTGRLSLSEHGTSITGFVKGVKIAAANCPILSRRICFHFVGQLSLKEKLLLNSLVRLGLAKIWGPTERNVALSMQTSAELLLLITKPMAENAISGKLIEYLGLGKPIFALTSGSEAQKILERTGLGLIVPPNDPVSISNMLIRISRGDFAKGEINMNEVSQFSDRTVMRKLAKSIFEIANASNQRGGK